MDDINTDILGRKVFFLHPSAFVQNTIIEPLVQQEYEIYLVKDETKLQNVLRKYPDSIIFACIDEGLTPKQWEGWIRQIRGGPTTKGVSIGILSNTNADDVRQLYVDTLKVHCGFIPVKMDKDKVVKMILDALNAENAKGRRKFIRSNTRGDTKTTINLPVGDQYITGDIYDISVVGLSCAFTQDISLEMKTLFHDIQIKLQGTLLKVEGIVYGSRLEGRKTVYVFIFSPKTDASVKAKIRVFIQKRLQIMMDEELQ